MTEEKKNQIYIYSSLVGSALIFVGATILWITSFNSYGFVQRQFDTNDLIMVGFLFVQICNIINARKLGKSPEIREAENKVKLLKLQKEQTDLEKQLKD